MKQGLLILVSLAFFILTISCEKAQQTHLLSAHIWVIADNSPSGTPGFEYTFHDNQLFFQKMNGLTIDGRWTLRDYELNIETDFNSEGYYLNKLTTTELELTVRGGLTTDTYYFVPKP